MQIIFKYFWLIAVLVGVVNHVIIRSRVQKLVENQPDLEQDAPTVLNGYLLFMTVPFLLVGMVQLIGGFESPMFLYDRNLGNPFALIADGIILFCLGVLAYWVYLRDGAQTLIRFQLLENVSSVTQVKFFSPYCC